MSLKLNWACCFSMLEPQSVLEKTLALSSVLGALHIPELTFLYKNLLKNYTWRQNRMTMLPSCLKSPTNNINHDFQIRTIRIMKQSLVITEIGSK